MLSKVRPLDAVAVLGVMEVQVERTQRIGSGSHPYLYFAAVTLVGGRNSQIQYVGWKNCWSVEVDSLFVEAARFGIQAVVGDQRMDFRFAGR